MVTVGLAGFASAGQGIHAPLIQAAGLQLAAVATANPERVEQAGAAFPDAEIVPDLDALLRVDGLDLVVLATPSGLHADQARQVDRGRAAGGGRQAAGHERQRRARRAGRRARTRACR